LVESWSKNKKGHRWITYGPLLKSLFNGNVSHGEDAVALARATISLLTAWLPTVQSRFYIAVLCFAGQASA